MKLMPLSRASFTMRVVSSWPRLPMFILPPNCMLPSAPSLTMSPVDPSFLCFISCAPCAASERLRSAFVLVSLVQPPLVRGRLPSDNRRHDRREVEVGGAMLCGFVQPGAIRPGLFEVAGPGGGGFRDESQVFRGMPEFEAGRELTRLDVGSLGFDDGSDGRVGEDVEKDLAFEREGVSERERFAEGHDRGAQGKVGHELHGGSRSGAPRMPYRTEG